LVVSDTSPIRALNHLGLTLLLQAMYDRVIVPPGVADELASPQSEYAAVDLSRFGGIDVVTPALQAPDETRDLHRGEREAITLAIEQQAAALMIDERAGRLIGKKLGLRVVRVAGILGEAKLRGLVPSARSLLVRLRDETHFWIADEVIDAVDPKKP
jgi:predicted nucleic acid-binding protein